jgi:hypothetical protein
MPSYDGISSRIALGGLRYVLRYLGSQLELGPCTGVPIVIPDSMLWAVLEPFRGANLRTPDQYRAWSPKVLWRFFRTLLRAEPLTL